MRGYVQRWTIPKAPTGCPDVTSADHFERNVLGQGVPPRHRCRVKQVGDCQHSLQARDARPEEAESPAFICYLNWLRVLRRGNRDSPTGHAGEYRNNR